jgi:hypothetical protein
MAQRTTKNAKKTTAKATAVKATNVATRKAGKPAKAPVGGAGTKKARVLAMLAAEGGATLDAITRATGWQRHTVRGFVATVQRAQGITIHSYRDGEGERTYALHPPKEATA